MEILMAKRGSLKIYITFYDFVRPHIQLIEFNNLNRISYVKILSKELYNLSLKISLNVHSTSKLSKQSLNFLFGNARPPVY